MSAPSLSAASSPAWKPAARPLLLVSRTMWSTPCARATSMVRSVEPSSITSHSTASKPGTSRGRSASVTGSVCFLVLAGDLDDELHSGPVDGTTRRRGMPGPVDSGAAVTTLLATDRAHLARAVELAEGGRGRVSPNPLVGAVVVKDGAVVGEGFHARYGAAHAEREALAGCGGADPAGATMYVSLEPCCHEGRRRRARRRSSPPGSPRRGRLRRPDAEGDRPRPGDPARRGRRGGDGRRRAGRRGAAAQPAVPQARPDRAARTCSSSRR